MKPIKNIQPFSVWLMRFAVLIFALVFMGGQIKQPDFGSANFYAALAFVIGAVLIFVGSLSEGPTLSVLGGLFIVFVAVFKLIMNYKAMLDNDNVLMFLLLPLGLFYVSIGNKL